MLLTKRSNVSAVVLFRAWVKVIPPLLASRQRGTFSASPFQPVFPLGVARLTLCRLAHTTYLELSVERDRTLSGDRVEVKPDAAKYGGCLAFVGNDARQTHAVVEYATAQIVRDFSFLQKRSHKML